MHWLANNLGVVITGAVLLVTALGAWFSNGARVSRLEEKQEKADKTAVENQNRLENALAELTRKVHDHQADIAIHIDPARDKKMFEDFKSEAWRRFDRLDDKMDKLMLINPVPPI